MSARFFQIRCSAVLVIALLSGAAVQATPIRGTVTNKTTNRPSAGDRVVLVDVGAGMSEADVGTTNADGQYSLQAPGAGPYLIRVDHQGGTYFIAAPQGSASADVTVYDVATKVDGVAIDADMLLVEGAGGTLRVRERYLVRNTSLPPRAQFSSDTFEIVIPEDAVLDEAAATRPGGLGTRTHPVALSQKGHYSLNVPIQPDQGEKETLFEVQYHLAYSGKYEFALHPQMSTDNIVVYTAKGIGFSAAQSTGFRPTQEDPRVDTYVAKNVHPGETIGFTVSGEGQMPTDSMGPGMQQSDAVSGGPPGGGLGVPIGTPDALTSLKGWILAALALLLTGSAFLVLRTRNLPINAASGRTNEIARDVPIQPAKFHSPSVPPMGSGANAGLLETIKEELFAIEREKLAGQMSASEYSQVRAGLEALLKRTLQNRNEKG
jgi:hypothetical protein